MIGKVNSMCTSFINESISEANEVSNDNNNTSIYIGLFLVTTFVGVVVFCFFAYFKWIKGKNLFEERFENKNFNDVSEIHGNY